MAENTTKKTEKVMNVYQKLQKARTEFLTSEVKKTGKNMHLAFKYFELDDIVPTINNIFDKLGLLSVVNFNNECAMLIVFDTNNPEDTITFTAPMITLGGNNAVNPLQAFGSSVTYYRRYLYMMALDICEPDNIEPILDNAPSDKPTPKPDSAKITPAPAEKPLTAADGQATELQIKQMKELLKQLREKDPSKEEWIHEIAVDTKGFTVISKAECETLVKDINKVLNGGE